MFEDIETPKLTTSLKKYLLKWLFKKDIVRMVYRTFTEKPFPF